MLYEVITKARVMEHKCNGRLTVRIVPSCVKYFHTLNMLSAAMAMMVIMYLKCFSYFQVRRFFLNMTVITSYSIHYTKLYDL